MKTYDVEKIINEKKERICKIINDIIKELENNPMQRYTLTDLASKFDIKQSYQNYVRSAVELGYLTRVKVEDTSFFYLYQHNPKCLPITIIEADKIYRYSIDRNFVKDKGIKTWEGITLNIVPSSEIDKQKAFFGGNDLKKLKFLNGALKEEVNVLNRKNDQLNKEILKLKMMEEIIPLSKCKISDIFEELRRRGFYGELTRKYEV